MNYANINSDQPDLLADVEHGKRRLFGAALLKSIEPVIPLSAFGTSEPLLNNYISLISINY